MQPVTDHLRLELTNELGELRRLGAAVAEFAASAGLSEMRCFDLRLILEEVAANIIRHAWDGGQHTFAVSLTREPVGVVAFLEDDGRPYNPLDRPPFDPDTQSERRTAGGLGVYLIRQLTDELIYERHGDRNQLRLTVRPRPDPQPETDL